MEHIVSLSVIVIVVAAKAVEVPLPKVVAPVVDPVCDSDSVVQLAAPAPPAPPNIAGLIA
jgi:hypothetical protein